MLTSEELDSLRSRIRSYRNSGELPPEKGLTDLLNKVLTVFENEDPSYRPLARNGEAGGLLDFTGKSLPVVVVPDLHARPDFLLRLLSCKIKGREVLDALNEGMIIVVCVGDGVHSERYGETVRAERKDNAGERWKDDYERWLESFVFWQQGRVNCPSMQEEMRLCLATVMAVMELKIAFPEHFHFLKGNHENMMNIDGMGDHAFRKFAMEGEMVRDFMQEVYGDAVLHLMRCYETSLPIVAAFDCFCVSHAEPAYVFTRDEIINYHDENLRDEVVLAFTWTPNDGAEEGSVASIFAELSGRKAEDALWFGGHRPVEGKYALRQDGHYVQIHNPDEMNVAYISADRPFNLDKDIIPLVKG